MDPAYESFELKIKHFLTSIWRYWNYLSRFWIFSRISLKKNWKVDDCFLVWSSCMLYWVWRSFLSFLIPRKILWTRYFVHIKQLAIQNEVSNILRENSPMRISKVSLFWSVQSLTWISKILGCLNIKS